MNANINIKITYDDLSEQCKQKIKKLEKELDCTVNLIYPDITSTPNITFGKTYPYISYGSGSSGDQSVNTPPHDVYDWKDNINDLVLRSQQCNELDDLVLRSPHPRDKDGNPQVVLCSGKSSSSSRKTHCYNCN